jgi:hypothetical protein
MANATTIEETLMNPFNALRRKSDMPNELVAPKTAVVQRRAIETEVQAVLANFADLRAERDQAMKMVTDARDHIVGLNDEVTRLKDHIARQDDRIARLQDELTEAKSRTTVYQLERDGAVAKTAGFEGLFKSIKAMLDAHGVVGYEREPIAADVENSIPALDYRAPRPPTPDEMIARISGQ